MPGTSYIRGGLVNQALSCRKLFETDLDKCVRRVLQLVRRVQPLGIPENAPENTANTEETARFLRTLSSQGIVLMKNEKNVLPFKKDKSVAVIGPNANFAAYCGGGSASLVPYYARTPLEGIKGKAKNVKYALGAVGWKKLPLISRLTKTKDGRPGMVMRVYLEPPTNPNREQIDEVLIASTDVILVDYKNPQIKSNLYWGEIEGVLEAEETAEYEFGLSVAGTAVLYIDGNILIDNATHQVPGDSFFGAGTREELGRMRIEKGKKYKILVKFGTLPTQTFKTPSVTAMGAGGLRVGGERASDPESEIDRAVKLAKECEQVVICAGLNMDWESEGYDRMHMGLPPHSDELISAVLAANTNTVVVIQSGTPVAMPWLPEAPALLQAWYGGNEGGNAIADVLFGDVNPSGKLPLTFPHRNEDNPAFLNFRSERGRAIYGEDVYIGYRFYEKTKKEVAFPFGHGLSYTQFEMQDLSVSDKDKDNIVTATVTVSNTGSVDGEQVVQVYVTQQNPSINRPVKELKGFAKVSVKAGDSKRVEVSMNKKYAASFWDEQTSSWIMEKDKYTVLVGDSSANTPLQGEFEVKKTAWWKGL